MGVQMSGFQIKQIPDPDKRRAAEDRAQRLLRFFEKNYEGVIKNWAEDQIYFLLKQIFTALQEAGKQQPTNPKTGQPYKFEELEAGDLYKIARQYRGLKI